MNLKWMLIQSRSIVPHFCGNTYKRLLVTEPEGKLIAEVWELDGIWNATILDGWPSGSIGKYISLEHAMRAIDEVAPTALKCKQEMVRQLKAQMVPDGGAGVVQ